MLGIQPLTMTPIIYAMTEMIDPSVCNANRQMCISKYYFDNSKYNAPKVDFLYYSKPAYAPSTDPLCLFLSFIIFVVAYGDVLNFAQSLAYAPLSDPNQNRY